ncbi:MAG: hypothetical protein ACKOPE_05295 [Novosphingobium sp.]
MALSVTRNEATCGPPPPRIGLSIGVTGHRASNPVFAANRTRIEAVLEEIYGAIGYALGTECPAPVRLHTLLAEGADQIAAEAALARGWQVIAPLPFGTNLNLAINAAPHNPADARALLAGEKAQDPAVEGRAAAIRALGEKALVFELADADSRIAELYLAMLDAPADLTAAQHYSIHASDRVALAGRVMIEQSDIVIGIWDGRSRAFDGGTGHTIATALELGAPVLLIDAAEPEQWRVLRTLEALAHRSGGADEWRLTVLTELVHGALHPIGDGSVASAMDALAVQTWRRHSNPLFHAYRRIEALFGGEGRPFRRLYQTYERPDQIATGSGARTLATLEALPGADPAFAGAVENRILRRFAWSDGISTRLSDLYRGGMVANFVASGLAIVAGVAYLPLVETDSKWIFSLTEFLLLTSILIVTSLGRRGAWHARWFETRRVAEYLRHAPILLAIGAARAPGHWPRGTRSSWPEFYARQSLREVGLPRIAITQQYLRATLEGLIDAHVVDQRDYHRAKAQRLSTVHHRLDLASSAMFQLAVFSVSVYLGLTAAAAVNGLPGEIPHSVSKIFTFLGVLFPAMGGMIAGIRYFGDFDRFAAISEMSAKKLDSVHRRAHLVLTAPGGVLDYGSVADLARAADDIVVSEIENWQAVFGGKHITVPV